MPILNLRDTVIADFIISLKREKRFEFEKTHKTSGFAYYSLQIRWFLLVIHSVATHKSVKLLAVLLLLLLNMTEHSSHLGIGEFKYSRVVD